jgi:integrase
MSENHSTAPAPTSKPTKPYPDFPLFPHATKRWAKKIRGQMHYFGPWDDPDGALAKYLEQKDALHAGRTPRPEPSAVTVKDAVNAFLNHKKALLDTGELSRHTWAKYKTACDEVIAAFGKSRLAADLAPDDFAALRKRMSKKWGPHRLRDMIQNVRSILKHAYDVRLLPLPVCFGPGFASPSKKVLRLHRAEQGAKLFTSAEIRRMIAAANPVMRAIILLGINCGFGNADCGNLPLSAVDLDAGIIDYPRPKTGIARRCCLWPETADAIRTVLEKRPTAKDAKDAGLVFLTHRGGSWAKNEYTSPMVLEMRRLLKKLGINGRKRLGFYALRHTFRTVADESKDQPATDFIMGHEVPHMSAVYRETISDARLRAVADHVRRWLFPSTAFVKPVVSYNRISGLATCNR